MAWHSEIKGYLDPNTGARVIEKEDHAVIFPVGLDIRDLDGVFVHAWNPDDPEQDRWFWVYHPGFFRDWDELDFLIDIAAAGYGLELE